MTRTLTFTLNGRPRTLDVDDERRLLWVLRTDLGLTGTKYGCGRALCGACTVVVDRRAVRACQTPMSAVAGRDVVTIEGLASTDGLHPLQQAFLDQHAFQCGFCTPGMLLSAFALFQTLDTDDEPADEDIGTFLEGHLCRCGSYRRIVTAIHMARTEMLEKH